MVEKEKEKIIQRVWENKGNKQKLITIPKDCEINTGDIVQINKIGSKEGYNLDMKELWKQFNWLEQKLDFNTRVLEKAGLVTVERHVKEKGGKWKKIK